MAFRDKLMASADPYLEPGEQVQAVFVGQTVNPVWALLSYWIILANDAYRSVVVTDRRIIVFRTSRVRYTKFKRVEAVLPRSILLEEPSGLNARVAVLGEPMWVNRRFHKDVRAANAALGYASGFHPQQAQFPTGQYAQNPTAQGQYPQSPYAQAQYPQDQPQYAQPQHGEQQYGQQQYGQPQYGQQQYGQPQYGEQQYGQ